MEPKLLQRQPEKLDSKVPIFPAAVLDSNDLAELLLKRMAGVPGGARGLSLSNNIIQHDESLRPLISQLDTAGRVRVKQDLPRRGPYGGGVAGSTVLYFEKDESISQLIGTAPLSDFDPLLNYYAQYGSAIQAFSITQNMGTSKRLKGVEVHFNQQADKWWRIAAQLPWSLQRGVIVAKMSIEINEFLSRADDISAQIYKIASAVYSTGELQRVNLAISPDNDVILEMVAGLSASEAKGVRENIITSNSAREVDAQMKELESVMRERRLQMTTSLVSSLGFDTTAIELLAQKSYTYLDILSATMGSGVIRSESDPTTYNSMTIGQSGIILLDQHVVSKVPAGIPLSGSRSHINRPPRNAEMRKLGAATSKIKLSNLDEMASNFMNSVTPVFEAEVLCTPYFKRYKEKQAEHKINISDVPFISNV